MAKKHKKFNTAGVKNKGDIKEKLPLLRILYISLAMNVVVIVLIAIFKNRLPPEVPLFYGLPEGPAQLTQKNYLNIPSVIALVFNIINVGIVLITKNDFLKRTLIITGIVLTLFAVTTTLKIMLLVGDI